MLSDSSMTEQSQRERMIKLSKLRVSFLKKREKYNPELLIDVDALTQLFFPLQWVFLC